MAATKQTPLADIAKRINTHLVRIENSPKLNPLDPKYRVHKFYCARAYVPHRGRLVHVTYINYQGTSKLSREDAEKYLAWLDAGNVGKHYEALRS